MLIKHRSLVTKVSYHTTTMGNIYLGVWFLVGPFPSCWLVSYFLGSFLGIHIIVTCDEHTVSFSSAYSLS